MAAPLNPKTQDLVARLNRDPDSKIFLQLAEEYRRAGHLEEALLVCKGGLKKHPGYHSARVALGRIFLALGRLEEARVEFEAVARASPENLLTSRMLGDVLAMSGDAAGARERYRAVVMYGPADNEIRAKLEALERGEDPHRVGSWGNEPPGVARTPAAPSAAGAPRPQFSAAPVPLRRVLPPDPEPPPPAPPRPAAVSPAATVAIRPLSAPPPAPGPPKAAAKVAAVPPAPAVPGGMLPPRDSMNTQTMAELYARQGFMDRAIEVYRRILNQEPGNASATRRLAELVKMAPQASAGAALATASPAAVSAPTARPIRPDSGSAAIIQRLGGWLRAIQAGRP